jgi:hypothetical protein
MNVLSFMLSIIGLAMQMPVAATKLRPHANGTIVIPNVPPRVRIGIFIMFMKQKNAACVPTYDCGDNLSTNKR